MDMDDQARTEVEMRARLREAYRQLDEARAESEHLEEELRSERDECRKAESRIAKLKATLLEWRVCDELLDDEYAALAIRTDALLGDAQ